MSYSINDFLQSFNDGELDVIKYFNSYDTWFAILAKKGLLSEIDPINGYDAENWQNHFLLWLYNSDNYEKLNYWVEKMLSDVEFKDGKIFLVRSSRGDLADLFCRDRRNDLDQETIRKLLDGDGDIYEPYWNTTDDVYRDVIDELDKKNIEILKSYIIRTLKDKELSPETSEMQLIASEQGHDDFWKISEENVSRIIDDEESMNSLLDDELSDLKSELYSVHSNSYNSAYESEIWEDIFEELGKYFDGYGNFELRPHPYKQNTQQEFFRIEISDFYGLLSDYLNENKRYGNPHNLEYQGSFLSVLGDMIDCLGVYPPDYTSFSKIDKNINEYFSEYIS